MFYGRNASNGQEVNLNTNLFNSYSDTAQVTAGAWNRQLSLQIRPCVGQDSNGLRQYAEDKNQYISTSITQENAICLVKGFEEQVIPALNGAKPAGSASIVMGGEDARKILTIGYENGEAYLSIATGLNSVGQASSEIRHVFNKKSYLVDYIPSQGNAVEKSVEAELINFMNKVKSVNDLSPVIAHSIRYYEMTRGARSNSQFGNGQRAQQAQIPQNNYSAPVSNTESLDDFLPFS